MTTPDIAGLCELLRAPHGGAYRLEAADALERQAAEAKFNARFISLSREFLPVLLDTLERQDAERDALRLAILGGEDVPGVAATVSVDQCIRFLTEERQRNEWSAEQQAKLERQAAELVGGRKLCAICAKETPDHG